MNLKKSRQLFHRPRVFAPPEGSNFGGVLFLGFVSIGAGEVLFTFLHIFGRVAVCSGNPTPSQTARRACEHCCGRCWEGTWLCWTPLWLQGTHCPTTPVFTIPSPSRHLFFGECPCGKRGKHHKNKKKWYLQRIFQKRLHLNI